MKRSLLIFSAWISLVLPLTSCLAPKIIITGETAASYDKTMQAGKPEKFIYKTTVSFNDNELSGRILLKKIDDKITRIAFYNELGMTYLEGTMDISSEKKKLIIHTVIPALDKKMFLRKFEKSVLEIIQNLPQSTQSCTEKHREKD